MLAAMYTSACVKLTRSRSQGEGCALLNDKQKTVVHQIINERLSLLNNKRKSTKTATVWGRGDGQDRANHPLNVRATTLQNDYHAIK